MAERLDGGPSQKRPTTAALYAPRITSAATIPAHKPGGQTGHSLPDGLVKSFQERRVPRCGLLTCHQGTTRGRVGRRRAMCRSQIRLAKSDWRKVNGGRAQATGKCDPTQRPGTAAPLSTARSDEHGQTIANALSASRRVGRPFVDLDALPGALASIIELAAHPDLFLEGVEHARSSGTSSAGQGGAPLP